jgi:hypothetical protein
MSTPVHYDVDAATAAFRASAAALELPADAPLSARIHRRHTAISEGLLRMMLEELNAGATPLDILDATASIVASQLDNMVRPYPDEIKRMMSVRFLANLSRIMERYNGADYRLVATSESAPIPSVQGGHA